MGRALLKVGVDPNKVCIPRHPPPTSLNSSALLRQALLVGGAGRVVHFSISGGLVEPGLNKRGAGCGKEARRARPSFSPLIFVQCRFQTRPILSPRVRSATTATVGSLQHRTALTLDHKRLSRVLWVHLQPASDFGPLLYISLSPEDNFSDVGGWGGVGRGWPGPSMPP